MKKLTAIINGIPIAIAGYLANEWEFLRFLEPWQWGVFGILIWLGSNYSMEIEILFRRARTRIQSRHVPRTKLRPLTYDEWLEEPDSIEERLRQVNYEKYRESAKRVIKGEWWHFWTWHIGVTTIQKLDLDDPSDVEEFEKALEK